MTDPNENFLEVLTNVFRSDLDSMGLVYQQDEGNMFVLPAGYTGVQGATRVFPYLFQNTALTKATYGKPFLKLNRTMFPVQFDGMEGLVQVLPGVSTGLQQTIVATVSGKDVMSQDVIHGNRPHTDLSYIMTYKATLSPFNPRLAVKIGSGKIPKTTILHHFEKDDSFRGSTASHRGILRRMIETLPDFVRADLFFKKNSPRVAYLVFRNLTGHPGKVSNGVWVHPISLMTVNNWIMINAFFDSLVQGHFKIPFEAKHVNSIRGDHMKIGDKGLEVDKQAVDRTNTARYGQNFLKFFGDIDLDWLATSDLRKALFTDEEQYDLFVQRESDLGSGRVIKRMPTHDEMYREAVRRAQEEVLEGKFDRESDAYDQAVRKHFEAIKRAGSIDE